MSGTPFACGGWSTSPGVNGSRKESGNPDSPGFLIWPPIWLEQAAKGEGFFFPYPYIKTVAGRLLALSGALV